MGVYGVARLGSIHNTYNVPSEPERAAKARRAVVASFMKCFLSVRYRVCPKSDMSVRCTGGPLAESDLLQILHALLLARNFPISEYNLITFADLEILSET